LYRAGSNVLKSLAETERQNLRAVVFLDHLGRVPPAYAYIFVDTVPTQMVGTRMSWAPGADSHKSDVLKRDIAIAAHALKLPEPFKTAVSAPTDALVFAQAKVPLINFYSPLMPRCHGSGAPRDICCELNSIQPFIQILTTFSAHMFC
jgi:hypothetical protein